VPDVRPRLWARTLVARMGLVGAVAALTVLEDLGGSQAPYYRAARRCALIMGNV
jgi:hypothetical protein